MAASYQLIFSFTVASDAPPAQPHPPRWPT